MSEVKMFGVSSLNKAKTLIQTDNLGSFINKQYHLQVMMGMVSGVSMLHALGERVNIGTTATGEDIWRGNDLSATPSAPASTTTIPTPASAGEQMTVISEDAQDTFSGTGVQQIELHYLDGEGNEQEETILMSGTTPVNTIATDIKFVQDLHTLTVGSNGVAEGNIRIYKTGTSNLVYNMIAVGGNQSLVPIKMIPTGKTLYLQEWYCSEAKNKRVAFRIRSTDHIGELLEGVFLFKGVTYLNQSSSGLLPVHTKVPAGSIVKVSGWATVSGGDASCGWWGYLVDD